MTNDGEETQADGTEEEAFLESSGGVVYRQKNKQLQVALVQTQRGAWVLPKGAVETEENPKQAAVREVLEETGIVAEIEEDLGEIRYEVRPDLWTGFVPKVVHQYLLKAVSGSIRPDPSEHVAARWVDVENGVRILHHANERTVMLRAEEFLLRKRTEDKTT